MREQADKPVLRVVGVLIFVHHQIAVAVLIPLQHIRTGQKQLNRLDQQVVKIQRVRLLEPPLIDRVALSDFFQTEIVSDLFGIFIGREQRVLGAADGG